MEIPDNKRSCLNCKYGDFDVVLEPCKTCFEEDNTETDMLGKGMIANPKWEPEP